MKKILSTSAALALSVAPMTTMGTESASASQRPSAVASQPSVTELRYSTQDVLSFFVLSTGPLFDTHAVLADELGLQHQEVPEELVTDVVDRFEAADPELLERVIAPVQSGDPLRAQAGMDALSEDAKIVNAQLMREQGRQASDQDRASARGWLYTTSYVATVQVGAAAAYVAALGAAVVAGVVVVLYQPNREATQYDRQLAARAISGAL